ncbi:Hypothetical protein POVR1_LOCUS436 [uncultured virus]|nr:Hypothetical protein POVR1_LOCUS436 [uncultured virus]
MTDNNANTETSTENTETAPTVNSPQKYALRSVPVERSSHVIRDLKKWDKTKIKFDPFVETKNEKSGTSMYNAKIQYDYGEPGIPDYRDLKVESPKTTSPYPIKEMVDQETKKPNGKYSITCYYDLNNPTDKVFLQTILHDIYVAGANHTAAAKLPPLVQKGFGPCKRDLDQANPRSDFNYPVRYKKEEAKPPRGAENDPEYVTRQSIIAGSKPYVYYDVRLEGNGKSNFHSDDNPPKEIPKIALTTMGIIHIPHIHFASVFIGAANKIKMFVKSSCVDEFVEANASSMGELLDERWKADTSTAKGLLPALDSVMDMVKTQEVKDQQTSTAQAKAPEPATQTPVPQPSATQAPPHDATSSFSAGLPQNYPPQYGGYPPANYHPGGYPQANYPPNVYSPSQPHAPLGPGGIPRG